MKICIIGNSYSLALKHGLDGFESPLKGHVTFIMSPKGELVLDISETTITPTAQRSHVSYADDVDTSQVLIDDYDAFVVVGLSLSESNALRVYRDSRPSQHATPNKHMLSPAAYTAAVKGMLAQSLGYTVTRQLRDKTDKPIYWVPQPAPVEKVQGYKAQNDLQKSIIMLWTPAFDEARGRDLHGFFVAGMSALAKELDVTFLPQPEVTRGPVFTKDEYQVKCRLLFSGEKSQPHVIEDLGHMNDEFGRLVLAQIAEAVLPPEPPAAKEIRPVAPPVAEPRRRNRRKKA